MIKGKYMKYIEWNLNLVFRLHLYVINHCFIITIKEKIVCLYTFLSLLNHLKTDHCRHPVLLQFHMQRIWECI